jgi:hypothetical protein
MSEEQHEREMDLSEEEGFPPKHPDEAQVDESPAFTHTPETAYWYDGSEDTIHRVLGLIEPGENRWVTEEPDMVEAIEALVASGVLRPMTAEEASAPEHTDDTAKDTPDGPHGTDRSA